MATLPERHRLLQAEYQAVHVQLRIADLQALLEQLRKEGVQVDDKVEEYEFGKFGWVMDPEGNRVELWQPPQGS